jgi:hypothetical protein
MANKTIRQISRTLTSLDGTESFEGQDGTGSFQATLATLIAELNPVKQVTVEISSAELLAIHTTPKEIVPAPGAGFYIQIIGASAVFFVATTAYNIGDDQKLVFHDRSDAYWEMPIDANTSTDAWNSGYDAQNGTWDFPQVENKSIDFTDTADWTDGDGTLSVTVQYVIIPV